MPAAQRILIVDDHERFRTRARRLLEREGWTVVAEAPDGASALAAAGTVEADVVLLDVGLPDMSGLDVADRLRHRAPGLAVVVTSTQDASDFDELALAHGARGFVPKAELSGAALEAVLGR